MNVANWDVAQFRTRLGQTLAWLQQEKPFTLSGGTVKRTSRLSVEDEFSADNPSRALEELVAHRAALLALDAAATELPSALPPGRILLLLTDFNLKDGGAFEPSGEFLSGFNLPMCDVWIDFVEGIAGANCFEPALASWVPAELIELAQRGIDVNPEECLVWADEFAPTFLEAAKVP